MPLWAPNGVVLSPLPRSPSENILSKTIRKIERECEAARCERKVPIRVAAKALAVIWQLRCVRLSGGVTPSRVLRYLYTIDGWHGPAGG